MSRLLAFALMIATASPAGALTVTFDYTYDANGFFDSTRKAVLDQAGSFFENHLADTLDAITSSGGNQFNPTFTNPATGNTTTINGYSVNADTLMVFVGGRNLSGSTLGQGGPGGYSVSGTSAFNDTVKARGEAGGLTSPATDFGPWGGSISFDIGTSWYFDPNAATVETFTGIDFYSVALHELGHVLGIGTAGSWEAPIVSNQFTGTAAVAAFGDNVPVTSDHGHWSNGVNGLWPDGTSHEAAMTPSISPATRKRFTDVDMGSLSDIGWEVVAVPEPASFALVGGVVVLLLRRRTA